MAVGVCQHRALLEAHYTATCTYSLHLLTTPHNTHTGCWLFTPYSALEQIDRIRHVQAFSSFSRFSLQYESTGLVVLTSGCGFAYPLAKGMAQNVLVYKVDAMV